MEYLTSREVSEKWGIGQCRILRLAREGRIPGAVRLGKSWLIPKNAEKPADGRLRSAPEAVSVENFRFPIYVNLPPDRFVPPLSREELSLRRAQTDYFTCNFGAAAAEFEALAENASNVYVKICALFFICEMTPDFNPEADSIARYKKLKQALSGDFPYKKEMELFLPWLDCCWGKYKAAGERLHFDPEYPYHPSACYLIAYLSLFRLFPKDSVYAAYAELAPHELLCRQAEQDEHYLEAQLLHSILFVAYFLRQEESRMLLHLRCVLRIACAHDLLYTAADLYPYYFFAYDRVLPEFPADFAEAIRRYGKQIADGFAQFSGKDSIANIYNLLSEKDFLLLLHISQGYSNKQIAAHMNLSERTVAARLSEIYEKLGLKNRQELSALFTASLSGVKAELSDL